MVERLPLIFLLASHLLLSGVLSTSILTIENKCNDTIWPAIYSYTSEVSTTGFTLKRGETRAIRAPSSWYGLISGRTLCSNDSKGNFTCATGDCESNTIECPGRYSWSPVTYIHFRINYEGINSYTINLEQGYNLPLMVAPSQTSQTCISSGCMVDLNKTCPNDLKTFTAEVTLTGCSSECKKYGTEESCCTGNFKSKQTCKETQYSQNFERACPLAYTYSYGDNNSTILCPNSTDYVITFCPSSIPDITRSLMGPKPGAKDNSLRALKPILGGLAGLAVMIIVVAIVIIVRAKNARRKNDSDENIESAVMLRRYSYEQVEKMTNSFAHVLGKGGFGTVYKGRLPNAIGQEIALKLLDESKGNGQDFINELASMSRASHVNIVSLFGFCYEGSKRAIIYEFMPNGSLDKFLSKNMSATMDWKMLYNIAVGVARGLEYLHNSCVSKIVHFDIKPQNILMDEDCCPKISDFGLAKLGNIKESIISLKDMRGTIGYISPEVYYNNFGVVSHKSDVYSYGMVVLEMIGAKNKERVETSKFFPDYIYDDLERKETMRLVGDRIIEEDEEEEKIERKMKIVGLWCIQTNPSDRPSIRKVVEMLAGSLEALEIPPKPLMSLPMLTAWKTIEDSDQETSSFLTPNESKRS